MKRIPGEIDFSILLFILAITVIRFRLCFLYVGVLRSEVWLPANSYHHRGQRVPDAERLHPERDRGTSTDGQMVSKRRQRYTTRVYTPTNQLYSHKFQQ